MRFEHRSDRRIKVLAKSLRKPRAGRASGSGLGVPYETIDPEDAQLPPPSASQSKREKRRKSALARHRDASASEGPYATMPVPFGHDMRFGESHPFLVEKGDMSARHAALVVELYETGGGEGDQVYVVNCFSFLFFPPSL